MKIKLKLWEEFLLLFILFDEEYSKVYKPITIKFLYKKKMFDKIDDNLLKINSGTNELYICPKKNKENGFIKIS